LKVSLAKLGILAAIATALLLFATMRPGMDTPTAHADAAVPGGIAALPSAAPGLPGIADQGIPAIIHSGRFSGSNALVTYFCDPEAKAPDSKYIPGNDPDDFPGECPQAEDDETPASITFTMTQASGDGSLASSFGVGGSTLVCRDGAPCDLDDQEGIVTVLVNGGKENEILAVTAVDAIGESRSVQIVVVDTIYAWGSTGAVSTASQESPAFISYGCDLVGHGSVSAAGELADEDAGWDVWGWGPGNELDPPRGADGLGDLYNLWYGTNGGVVGMFASGSGLDNDWPNHFQALPNYWCGGDTGGLFDDFVDFQTDKGIFSVDPLATLIQTTEVPPNFILPLTLDPDCGEGKTIDTYDIDALGVWSGLIDGAPFEGGCDADFGRNGVVTTMLLGTGEVGVATITAQQGGGVSHTPRTINITFVGSAALSLFITAPASIGLTGGDFSVMVMDRDGRPVGSETVQCTVAPAGGAMVILNQTGTTGIVGSDNPGKVTFTLVPTGANVVAGDKLTITCVLDRDRSISASADVALSTTPELESVALVEGCNPIAATWPDATAIATVAGAVAPAEALDAIWKFDPATATWEGYAPPPVPADVNNLALVDRLDAIFVCVNAAATIGRPVI
jgi:hypothetical protein